PTAIQRLLENDATVLPTEVPTTKTIGEWRARELTRGRNEPWLFADAPPEQARLVLPALLELIRRTEGRVPHLTKSEGEWIYALRSAHPELPEWEAIKLARRYIRAGEDREELLALDRYLAVGVWRLDAD
ncbi:hypothetical protein, partial [Legionella pneumophila]|uniref:hypothetical protein n=1 Tax=Legionella pneumophila TaxID=446 RepID=UPI0011357905